MGEYAPPLGPPAARAAAAHRRTVRDRSGHLASPIGPTAHRDGDRRRSCHHNRRDARDDDGALAYTQPRRAAAGALGQPACRLDRALQAARGIVDRTSAAGLEDQVFLEGQLAPEVGRQDLGRGPFAPAWLHTEDDLVHDDAQRPDVGRDAGVPAAQQLGRHVRDGAAVHGARAVVGVSGQTEVGHDDAPVWHAQQVLRREIAVHDPRLVNRGQRRCDRARVGDPLGQRARGHDARADLLAQRALRELHHQEHAPVGVLEVEDAAHVRVLDLAGQLHLAREARRPHRLAGQLGADDLDRDGFLQIAIVRAHHDAATAAAQHLLDRVAAAQHHPVSDRKRLGHVRAHVFQLGPAGLGLGVVAVVATFVHRARRPSLATTIGDRQTCPDAANRRSSEQIASTMSPCHRQRSLDYDQHKCGRKAQCLRRATFR